MPAYRGVYAGLPDTMHAAILRDKEGKYELYGYGRVDNSFDQPHGVFVTDFHQLPAELKTRLREQWKGETDPMLVYMNVDIEDLELLGIADVPEIPPPPKPKPAANPPGGTLLSQQQGPPPPRQNPLSVEKPTDTSYRAAFGLEPRRKRKRDERPEPSPTGRAVAEDPLLDDAWVYAGQIVVMFACVGGILLDAALLYAKWIGRL